MQLFKFLTYTFMRENGITVTELASEIGTTVAIVTATIDAPTDDGKRIINDALTKLVSKLTPEQKKRAKRWFEYDLVRKSKPNYKEISIPS